VKYPSEPSSLLEPFAAAKAEVLIAVAIAAMMNIFFIPFSF
jgi:hypothetical protein